MAAKIVISADGRIDRREEYVITRDAARFEVEVTIVHPDDPALVGRLLEVFDERVAEVREELVNTFETAKVRRAAADERERNQP